MSFPDIVQFQITGNTENTGKLSINDCIWSITGDTSFSNTPHLSVDGGTLECNNLVVRAINKPNFQFIVYTDKGVLLIVLDYFYWELLHQVIS
jgi:hypothetical protein